MSIESRCTTGAMASKKARSRSPVSAPMAAASFGEVNGPVAMMTLVQSAGRQPVDLLAHDLDQRMGGDRRRDMRRKSRPVDGERAARRQLMRVGRGHDQRIEAAHFAMQHADGARLRIIGAKRIGADEFGEIARAMRRRLPHRAHLVQDDAQTSWRAICHAASAPARPPPMTWIGPGVSFEGFSFDIGLFSGFSAGRHSPERDEEKWVHFSARIPLRAMGIDHVHDFAIEFEPCVIGGLFKRKLEMLACCGIGHEG